MAFLLLPGQLTARSELYHQLGSSLAAGLPILRALEILIENPPARSLSSPFARVLRRLQAGDGFAEAMRTLSGWAPDFDIALLEAGEQSGRLDHACQLLSRSYQDRARLANQILLGLVYPVFVFHFAFLIMPVGHLVQLFHDGEVAAFLARKVAFFLPFYGLAGLAVFAAQGSRGRFWRSILEGWIRWVPFLGRARKALVLSRLSLALDALLNAGVSTVRAWPLAAAASGSPSMEREILRWIPQIENGRTPAEIIVRSHQFPTHFSGIYASSELSGRVDDALPRLSVYYQEEGLRLSRISANLLTAIIYGAVMLTAAYQIVSFWLGFYGQMVNME
ncbi:MAG: type II secretion system F family protein [Verrucomicrobiales bacterium]|nr:type II secretion system F family protein [Verrucomicrobiales bacterium]